MLPVAGSGELKACKAVNMSGPIGQSALAKGKKFWQTLIFRWVKLNVHMKINEPVPEVVASVVALTPSAAAHNAWPPPAQGLPESAPNTPVTAEAEASPELFGQQCVAGYAQDLFFQDEANLSDKLCRNGLCWFGGR